MGNLLEDLGNGLELSQNLEKTVENALSYYFNFERDTPYEHRIKTELYRVFQEKKNNKGYFFSPPNQFRLRALGFNQIIHILIKRLWDEEDFVLFSKIPKEISFLDLEATDVNMAKVSLEDAIRYVQNLRVLPFVVPEINFFTRKRPEQVRFCMQWLQKGNSVQNFLNRIKLVGIYPLTVFYAGQNLIELAKEFEKNPTMQLVEDEVPDEKIVEDKAGLLTRIILAHPMVESGYFKFSETTLRRTLFKDSAKALLGKENLNYIIDLLDKSKSNGLKVTEEQIKKAAVKIAVDYHKLIQNPASPVIISQPNLPPVSEKEEPEKETLSFDLAHAYDALVYELKAELKKSNSTISISHIIKSIVNKMKDRYHGISEKHLTVLFLYLKDLDKKTHTIPEGIQYMKSIGEKFRLSELEVYTIYFLMLTEKEKDFQEISLKEFVEECINDQQPLLNERQILILRSLFGHLPKEVSLNHFYQVKEKLKDRVEEISKKNIIETLSEYIHVKIAEKKGAWVVEKIKEHGLLSIS
jgi:hypothetical protein